MVLMLLCGKISKGYFDHFVDFAKTLDYIEIGRCTVDFGGNWNYVQGSLWCLRIYDRGLDEEGLKQNYEKTLAYRQSLKNEE